MSTSYGLTAITTSPAAALSVNGLNVSSTGTISGASLIAGTVANAALTNSSITVTAGTGLSGGGAVSLGSSVSLNLPTVAVTGTYGSATQVPVFVLDAQGRVTGTPTNTTITADAGSLTGTSLSAGIVTSSLTTVGTIGTGVWNATAIGSTKGGTGQTSYATGDILYASAANTLSKLPAGSNGQVLTLAAGVPSWAAGGGSGTVTSITAGTGLSGGTITTSGTISMTNTSVTVTASTGLQGGGSVALGGSVSLNISPSYYYGQGSYFNTQAYFTSSSGPSILLIPNALIPAFGVAYVRVMFSGNTAGSGTAGAIGWFTFCSSALSITAQGMGGGGNAWGWGGGTPTIQYISASGGIFASWSGISPPTNGTIYAHCQW